MCAVLSCSVMPYSLWHHGLLPLRLLCPWDSPGKTTGVGCHALLQGIFPIQGSNPGPTLQVDSLQTEPPGKPNRVAIALFIFFTVFLKLSGFNFFRAFNFSQQNRAGNTELPYTPCFHTHTASPTINFMDQSGTFFIVNESTPMWVIILSLRIHSLQ